ncbi:MAG: hypothetical protein HY791_06340 [Deltaproteobacteria bacterium]|nr:hypothetical protein [Deltaproteobacteria bacterium]
MATIGRDPQFAQRQFIEENLEAHSAAKLGQLRVGTERHVREAVEETGLLARSL